MSVNYFKLKQTALPVTLFLFFTFIGSGALVFFYMNLKSFQKQYQQELKGLELLVGEQRGYIPTQKRLLLLKEKRTLSEQRLEGLLGYFQKDNVQVQDHLSPLEFREILANLKEKYDVRDLGFSEYNKKVPKEEEMKDLKYDLMIVKYFLQHARHNKVRQVRTVVRSEKKEYFSEDQMSLIEYAVTFRFQTTHESLIKFLYDLFHSGKMFFMRGLVIQKAKYDQVQVLLKVGYLNIL